MLQQQQQNVSYATKINYFKIKCCYYNIVLYILDNALPLTPKNASYNNDIR